MSNQMPQKRLSDFEFMSLAKTADKLLDKAMHLIREARKDHLKHIASTQKEVA